MSTILPDIQQKIQSKILPLVKPKWKPMMRLGINGLSLTPFSSLNQNARLSRENEAASKMQMYRLIRHPKLNQVFATLLVELFVIDKNSVIAVDFTVEGNWAILCLGLQTKAGRAIPLWIDVLEYPVTDSSQNIFILETLKRFKQAVGTSFKIVCDRGFIGASLIQGFLDLELVFYVRLKSGMHWVVDGKRRLLKKQWKLDQTGTIYQKLLRIVRSSKTLQHTLGAKEPWYILTNDLQVSRDDIVTIYYHRFEIEESFKDLKHILNFSKSFIKKRSTIKTILWFQILGFWLLWQTSRITEVFSKILKQKSKKKRSWFNFTFSLLLKNTKRLILPEPPQRLVVSHP